MQMIVVVQTAPQFVFVLLSLFFRVGFPLFILAEWLLLCSQICDIHNLIVA
jgi:hypothetical protein